MCQILLIGRLLVHIPVMPIYIMYMYYHSDQLTISPVLSTMHTVILSVEFFKMSGRVVERETFDNSVIMNLSNLHFILFFFLTSFCSTLEAIKCRSFYLESTRNNWKVLIFQH